MLSSCVTSIHNSTRPAPSAATAKSRPITPLFAPRNSEFLIANPRLEIPVTSTKQTPDPVSNRKWIAICRSRSGRSRITSHSGSHPPRQAHARASTSRSVIAHRSSLVTNHSSLVTAFLIGTPRLEFPATHTKQSPHPISNRDTFGLLRLQFCPLRVFPEVSDLITRVAKHESQVTRHESQPFHGSRTENHGSRSLTRLAIIDIRMRGPL